MPNDRNNTAPRPGVADGFHRRVDDALSFIVGLPVRTQVAIALVAQVLVILVDAFTGGEISVSFFYLPGLVLIAWVAGPTFSMTYALASAVMERAILHWRDASPGVLAWNSVVRWMTFLAVIALVNALKRIVLREAELARTDPLTGLMNRRAFLERVRVELARSARSGTPFAIAYVDCDNFKQVNDTLGHRQGDELLQLIADEVRFSIRDSDAPARIGGDEFAVLFVEVNSTNAGVAAGKLHDALTKAAGGMAVPVGFSMGVAVVMRPAGSVEDLIHAADTLMFEVKAEGKGRVKLKEIA